METRQTTAFEVDLLPSENHRCYLCVAMTRPMFIVRNRGGAIGRTACIAHVGLLMERVGHSTRSNGWLRVRG